MNVPQRGFEVQTKICPVNHDSPTLCLDSIIFGLQRNGGISNYWMRLLDALSQAEPMNFHTILPSAVKYQGYRASIILGPTRVEAFPASMARYMSCPINAADTVMHTSYYRLPSRPVKRYVATAYDFMYERYRTGPALWVHSSQKRRSISRANIVSCISSFTRDEVLEFCPEVDPEKLRVVPLGVDTNAFFVDRVAADARLEKTVLFVGLRGGYKRFELAVEAVCAVNGVGLGIVGPALMPHEVDLLNTKLAGRWQTFGSVTSQRLRELYSSVYALIFPSDCEGFGLPVLEAMACGCPVVAASRASLPEVGGDAASFAPEQRFEDYAHALVLLDDASRRQAVISAGLKRVKLFSWEKTFQLTRELYEVAPRS